MADEMIMTRMLGRGLPGRQRFFYEERFFSRLRENHGQGHCVLNRSKCVDQCLQGRRRREGLASLHQRNPPRPGARSRGLASMSLGTRMPMVTLMAVKRAMQVPGGYKHVGDDA